MDKRQIQPIAPSREHPGYWAYDGRTVLLVGGSREDNLFQIPDLEEHLDTLAAVGGNTIRNTMSDRDPGDARAFALIESGPDAGKYDLERWNDAYWERFERLLTLCVERSIIVQIEVWDRFDHSRKEWQTDPFNPANNVNYSEQASGLALEYPSHPGGCRQPFFHTVPAMQDNVLLRRHQERYVEKLLSISLDYPNVLYCMNNETSEDPAWGQYWLGFIRERAKQRGVTVWATDMFDGRWQEDVGEPTQRQFAEPEMYPFVDISQINAWRCTAERHWSSLKRLRELNQNPVRPLTNTKVYSADTLVAASSHPGPRMTDRDGIASLWMNLLGGCASARFHRPTSGLGLSPRAQACIKLVRELEHDLKFWDLQPQFDWTGGRQPGDACLATRRDGRMSLILLRTGGGARLQEPVPAGSSRLRWLDLLRGQWAGETTVDAQPSTMIVAPEDGCWLALLDRVG